MAADDSRIGEPGGRHATVPSHVRSYGNRKITVTEHSPCDSPGMCGEVSANR